MKNDAREQLAAAAASMDQMNAFARDLATGVGAYMQSLLAAGLTREEAHQLAAGYQSTIMAILFVGATTQPAEAGS